MYALRLTEHVRARLHDPRAFNLLNDFILTGTTRSLATSSAFFVAKPRDQFLSVSLTYLTPYWAS